MAAVDGVSMKNKSKSNLMVTRCFSGPVVHRAATESEAESFVFRITDGSVDRFNTSFRAAGMTTENYLRSGSGIVLWNHKDDEPIGRSSLEFNAQEGAWFARFFPDRITQRSKDVAEMLLAGTLNGSSIRAQIKEESRDSEGRRVFDQFDLVEWSVVSIPANTHSVQQRDFSEQEAADFAALTEAVTQLTAKVGELSSKVDALSEEKPAEKDEPAPEDPKEEPARAAPTPQPTFENSLQRALYLALNPGQPVTQ